MAVNNLFPRALENESDRESQAYYSRVAKDEAQSLSSEQPPPLKEHLYQNFDQVFLAMSQQIQQEVAPHPDLLTAHDTDQFYENLRRPPKDDSKTVVVNDEKYNVVVRPGHSVPLSLFLAHGLFHIEICLPILA